MILKILVLMDTGMNGQVFLFIGSMGKVGRNNISTNSVKTSLLQNKASHMAHFN
jgi:hypothetical protein